MHSTPVRLPRTTSLQRVRSPRLWWLAITVAVALNVTLVMLLAQVSRLQSRAVDAPLTVLTLQQIKEQPESPPTPKLIEAQAAAPSEPVVIALPSLDLPTVPILSELRLPTFANLATPALMPDHIPAFAAFGIESIAAVSSGAGPLGSVDTPAVREGTFDLDRFYPRTARAQGVTGSSHLRLTIDASGRVAAAEVLASTPAGVFDSACERLARSLRFRPATVAGQPVASIHETTITWTLK